MKCKNPNCDSKLGFWDQACKKCGTWRHYTSPPGAKPSSKSVYSGKMAGPNPEKLLVNTQRGVVAKRVKPSFLRGLPVTFYLVASLTFFAYVFVWADSHNNISPRDIDGESGRLVVEGLLTAIAIFAGGRTIELLQNIDDELYRKRISE